MTALPHYAELHCLPNFSFLKGASHSEELVVRAVELCYERSRSPTNARWPRRARAWRKEGQRTEAADRHQLRPGLRLVLIATDLNGYGNLSELFTLGPKPAVKGALERTLGDDRPGAGDAADELTMLAGDFTAG